MAQDISSFLIISSTSSMDWSGFVSSFAREVYNKTDKNYWLQRVFCSYNNTKEYTS